MRTTTCNISHLTACILIIAGVIAQVSGQTHYWNTESGLSNDWVSQITQDDKGYVWIATQNGINRFDGYAFESHHYEPGNEQSISANWVRAMDQNAEDQFWLSIFLGGVNKFDPETGVAERIVILKDSSELLNVPAIYCDPMGDVWIGGRKGLFRKDRTNNQFELVLDVQVRQILGHRAGGLILLTNNQIVSYDVENRSKTTISSFKEQRINKIFYDRNQWLWALGGDRLFNYKIVKGEWTKEEWAFDNVASARYFSDTPIFEDSKGVLWIGGKQGITLINADRTNASIKPYSALFPTGNVNGNALTFFEDKHNNIWVGTSNGILLVTPFSERFFDVHNFRNTDDIDSPRDLIQIEDILWFANHEGLFCVNIKQKESPIKQLLSESIFAIHYSSNKKLYAGTLAGLIEINLKDHTTKLIVKRGDKVGDLKGGVLWSIAEDNNEHLWIGSIGALQRLDLKTNELLYFNSTNTNGLKTTPSQDLLIDRKGRLWAASLKSGLYMLPNPHEINHPSQANFRRFIYDGKNANSLCSDVTLFLVEGYDGSIWVATDGGLNRLADDGRTIDRYTRQHGMIDDKVMGLVADNDGRIWGSTIGHGIFWLDPKTQQFTFFNRKDGLVSNNFLLSSAFYNAEGNVLFGADNKLQIIDPLKINRVEKPLISCFFNKLTFLDQEKAFAEGEISISKNPKVDLPANRRSFRVHFTPLNFYQAEKTRYEFLLEGLHSSWQSNGHQRIFTFTGLAPGNYALKVKPSHPDLQFERPEYILEIHIANPWWSTWWAYLFYCLSLLFIAYCVYQFQLNRRLEKAESLRLQEIDTLKNRLYTNLTHELRTPLTIILGMANNLIEITSAEVRNKAEMIKRNGQNLLEVVNQILELSKVESGEVKVNWVHGDIISYMRYMVESFESFARSHKIQLHYLPEVERLFMDFDEEKIKNITSNLFSNAIKNTPEEGNLYLQIRKQGNDVEMHFRDTGKGISKDHLPFIFDRFYQTKAKQGSTGIGLSLTKELITLLGGTINVESEFGHGATFIVSLPIKQQPGIPSAKVSLQSPRHSPKPYDLFPTLNESLGETVPLILLIEDNDDVLYFLAETLKDNYRLAFAKNGKTGIEAALEKVPDIIVSDVMMPQKDGFEVCAELKTNDHTSHIPIILLTAKADTESRIEGLERGADAYLPKPFFEEELKVRIRKLLELRENLQRRYQKDEYWEHRKLIDETAEDAFVKNVRTIIEAHLSDSTFGISELCKEMAISRVHLHRKLKALTDQSASHFIRRIRLQKAKTLLIDTDLNISEIAYDVGFNDPAYFSRIYGEVFGKPPSAER